MLIIYLVLRREWGIASILGIISGLLKGSIPPFPTKHRGVTYVVFRGSQKHGHCSGTLVLVIFGSFPNIKAYPYTEALYSQLWELPTCVR